MECPVSIAKATCSANHSISASVCKMCDPDLGDIFNFAGKSYHIFQKIYI